MIEQFTIQRTVSGTTTTVFTSTLNAGSIVHRELMSEHYVLLKFTTAEPVYFKVGDYCQLTGYGRFELVDPYAPTFNAKTGGYDYELRLDAYYWKWKNKILKYVPTNAATETSFSLTAAIAVHIQVATRTINALGASNASYKYNGTTDYVYSLAHFTGDANAAKLITYDSTNIIDGLTAIAEAFECEWWVEDNCIYFGRCELGNDEITFEYGSNVCDMSSSQSAGEYATRVYAFGSDRNLPTNYREEASADVTVNGVIQKRLMLPLLNNQGQPLCPHGYVQAADAVTEEQAIETVIVFDDVYPRVQCVVDVVSTYTKPVIDEDGHETGETRTYYRVTDSSGFNFNTGMILEGQTLHIQFTSGHMNGLDFECQYSDSEHYYEIVANEDYGRFLPDSLIHPAHGDTFVLYGWDASQIASTGIIQNAEMELYDKAVAWLEKTRIDPNTYNCTLFSDWVEESEVARTYDLGKKVLLVNTQYFPQGRSSRIIGYELKLDYAYDSPQYIVGENAEYSRLKDVEHQVQELTVNGVSYIGGGSSGGAGVYIITVGDATPATDSNVFSARRSLAQFLRKDVADTARGRITFLEQAQHNAGTQFGQAFLPGLLGIGGKIDGAGHGELRSLTLWECLEVPDLRYNKVSVYIGIRWDTFGGGIIETITPDSAGAATGSGTLKLDDGEIGAIAVGDLCMGIWHDTSGNANENSDDNIGNFTFAGFKTVYFQITGVSGAHNQNFTYVLRSTLEGGNGFHPFVGMHFAGRGNISNTERQAFRYTTTEYSLSLTGVNTWEFQPSNYYEIHGHLEGFSMPAIDSAGHQYTKVFHGYGQVFGNAYVFGQIDQFERIAYRCFIEQSLGGQIAPNETEDVAVTILNGYGEDVTAQFTQYSVTRNSGDAASDAVWNAQHTNVGNPFQISFSDLGIDGIHRLVSTFTVTATDEVTSNTAQGQAIYQS